MRSKNKESVKGGERREKEKERSNNKKWGIKKARRAGRQ